jgi:hypothetical protein
MLAGSAAHSGWEIVGTQPPQHDASESLHQIVFSGRANEFLRTVDSEKLAILLSSERFPTVLLGHEPFAQAMIERRDSLRVDWKKWFDENPHIFQTTIIWGSHEMWTQTVRPDAAWADALREHVRVRSSVTRLCPFRAAVAQSHDVRALWIFSQMTTGNRNAYDVHGDTPWMRVYANRLELPLTAAAVIAADDVDVCAPRLQFRGTAESIADIQLIQQPAEVVIGAFTPTTRALYPITRALNAHYRRQMTADRRRSVAAGRLLKKCGFVAELRSLVDLYLRAPDEEAQKPTPIEDLVELPLAVLAQRRREKQELKHSGGRKRKRQTAAQRLGITKKRAKRKL